MALELSTSQPPVIRDEDFLVFREYFYRKTGIMFADNKRYFVDKRLQHLMTQGGHRSFRGYFDTVCSRSDARAMQSLVNAMTVNETYFYREEYQFKCLVQSMLPELTRTRPRGDTVKIWSVPCSTGEEPYSIAFYLLEHWSQVDDFNIEIFASDIDTEVMQRAKLGIYATRSLQNVSKQTLAKYTTDVGDGNRQVIEPLRNSIHFSRVNLLDLPRGDRVHNAIDVVFCRNVLIYFDDVSRRTAAEALFETLRPGGFVCLGHSESMSRISSLFQMRKFADVIVHQKAP